MTDSTVHATVTPTTTKPPVPFSLSELISHFAQRVVDDMDIDQLMASVKGNLDRHLQALSPEEIYAEINDEIETRGIEDDEYLQGMMMLFQGTMEQQVDEAYSAITSLNANTGDMVKINAPGWFENPAFIAALESPGIMTWHRPGNPVGDYSDVVLFIDPSLNGEGSDTDVIPDPIWQAVIDACKTLLDPKAGMDHVMVRITNLQE
jgi:hypothetical protein